MPLTLNVGLSKKVGQPDYGSLGASCNVEVELVSSLLQNDLETFHRHVKNAYVACAQAVNDELARHQRSGAEASRPAEAFVAKPANGNGRSHGAGNGTSNGAGQNNRASDKQLDYVHQLAGQIKGLGVRKLDQLAQRMHRKSLAELTSLEASGLIDTLKAIKAGDVGLAAALEGSREAA